MVFLFLYSYFLLCDFAYVSYVDNTGHNETVKIDRQLLDNSFENLTNNDDSNITYKHIEQLLPPATQYRIFAPIEYVLMTWIISFVLVECRQFFFVDDEDSSGKNTASKNIKKYFRDGWNYLVSFNQKNSLI